MSSFSSHPKQTSGSATALHKGMCWPSGIWGKFQNFSELAAVYLGRSKPSQPPAAPRQRDVAATLDKCSNFGPSMSLVTHYSAT